MESEVANESVGSGLGETSTRFLSESAAGSQVVEVAFLDLRSYFSTQYNHECFDLKEYF